MLKDTLLQVLIAFLPVFMFMVWYSKPERTRHSRIFLSIACTIAMCMSMHFSMVYEQGVVFDFRHIPFIVGCLYGGIPGSVLIIAVYIVTRLIEMSHQWEYLIFGAFIVIYLPILLSKVKIFQMTSRSRRLKIVVLLCALLVVIQDVDYFCSFPDMDMADLPQHLMIVLVFGVFFVAVALTCVHFTELGFERIQLQIKLFEVSNKYRNETRRLQQFIDNTPLIVVFCDNHGLVTHVNDMAVKLVSPLGRGDILHREFSFFLSKMDLEEEFLPMDRLLQGEGRFTEILKFKGRSFYTVTCPIKMMPAEGADGVLFIGHDITEIQMLKDEVNRMDRLSLVGQMAASITHEIRNPMAVIRGFVQLLNERSPVEQQSYFRIVMEELDRANSIINDFLSLAQNRIVEKEPSNLNDLLRELLPLLWADANMRGQMIEMRLSEEMELLQVNSKEMKQLILNLARNGMEAMDDKGVLLLETLDFKDTVQVRVVDQGVGIAQEKLERLFEPFYTTKTNGTGLGLALCFSIVERHNGKIQVESTLGQGTAFIVSFCKPGRYCW